jgi:predicted protein tyrosine phosphatase
MNVEKINIVKARELKKFLLEHPELADQYFLQNDLIHAILGKKEFFNMYSNIENKKDIVLISITEPNNDYIPDEYKNGFNDVLETKFWDIERDTTDFDGTFYPMISRDEAKKIKDFIVKNKDKKFLIHCAAGVSRSAGVGCAVECIVNYDSDVYYYKTSYSDIKNHKRYAPNYSVFDLILSD